MAAKNLFRNLFTRPFRGRRPAAVRKQPRPLGRVIVQLEDRINPSPLFTNVLVNINVGGSNVIQQANTSRNVAVAPNGNIFVAYTGTSGVFVAESTNRGQSFLPSQQLTGFQASEVDIAVNSTGNIYVAWNQGGTIELDISNNGGASYTGPVAVGPAPSSGLHLGTQGNFIYIVGSGGGGAGGTIFSNPNFGFGPFSPTTFNSGQAFADVQVDPASGEVFVLSDNPTVEVFHSTNHAASFTPLNLNAGTLFFSSYTASFGPGGRFGFGSGGSNSTQAYRIDLNTGASTPLTFGSDNDSQGRSLAADGLGDVVDMFFNSGNIQYHVSQNLGNTFAPPVTVAASPSGNVAINPTTQDIDVAFQQGPNIFLSVYQNELLSNGSLTATFDGAGNLVITDVSATGKNNNLTASVSGGNLVITDAAEKFQSAPAGGSLSNNNQTLTIPFGAIPGGQVIFNTAGGNDTLNENFSGGGFAKQLVFNGSTGFDTLKFVGGAFATGTFNYSNATDGSVALDGNSTLYTGLDPIDMTGSTAANLVFNLPAAASNAFLEDNGTSGDGISQLRSGNGTFETTTFANPSVSATVNRGNAADTLTTTALPDFTATLTVGSSGSSLATFTASAPLNLSNGSLTVWAGGITLAGGTVTTSGSQTYNGPVTVTADTTATGAGVTFNATVNSGGATFVGSFRVNQGPNWTTNPPVYSAQQAAALLFGGSPAQYSISINPNTIDPSTITFTGYYDGWGEHSGMIFPQNYSLDVGNPGYNDPGGTGTARSAYVQDGLGNQFVNYVWTASSGHSLTVNSPGSTAFNGAVGNTAALTSLTTDAPGTTSLNGGSVTTTGNQFFGDPIASAGGLSLTSTGGGTITVNNGTFGGGVNGPLTTSSANLVLNGASTVNGATSLTVTGLGSINGTVFSGGNGVTLAGGTFSLNGPFRFSSGGNPLTLTGATAVNFNNNPEQFFSLAGTNAGASINLGSGSIGISNGGGATYAGGVTGAGGGVAKFGPGTQTFSGSLTNTGQDFISGGTFTLTGSMTGAAAPVTINGNNVTLNGGGVINGRGVVVAGGITNALIQGLGGITNNPGGVGVTVNPGASARILNDMVTGNNIGVLVDGGTALLQGDVLSNNTGGSGSTAAGLVAQGGAIVDAGQLPASAPYYGNITGFGVSTGGNTFLGYTADISGNNPTVPQAIRDLNTGTAPFSPSGVEQSNNYGAAGPQLGRMDVTAQNNSFGVAQLFQIEQLIFHDIDNNAYGFVTYGTATAANPVVVGSVQYAADFSLGSPRGGISTLPAGSSLNNGQKSVIRFVQVTYSSFVFLDPNLQSPTSNRGLNLVKVNGYYGAAGGTLIHANVFSAAYNQSNGQYTVTYSFSGPGVEFGSLEDGNYTLQFNEGAIQGGGPGGPGLSPAGDPYAATPASFFRFFGDSNGDMQTDGTDLAAEQAAMRSRVTGPTANSYRSYFDFNWDGTIDSSDNNPFLQRYRSKLNANGTTSPLP